MSNKNNEVKSIFSQFVDLVKSKCCTNNFNIVLGEKGLNALIDDFRKDNYKFLRDFLEAARRNKANDDNFVDFEAFFNQIDLSKDKFDNLEDQKKFYLNTLSFMHDLMLMLKPDIKHYEWHGVESRNSMEWWASQNYRKYKLTFSSFFKYPGQGYLVKILDSMPKELFNNEDVKAKIKEIADDAVSDKYETKGLGVSSGSWIEIKGGKSKPDGLDDVTKVFGYHDAHFSLQTYLYRKYALCFTDEDKMNFFNKLEAELDAVNNGERKGRYLTKDSKYGGIPVERYDDCILGKNSIRDIYEVLKDTIDKQKLAKTLARAMFYFVSPEPNGLSEDDFKWYFDTFGDDINDKIDINLNVDFDSYTSNGYTSDSMGPFECFNNFIRLQVSPILLKFIAKIRITGRKNNFRGFDIEHVTATIINSKNTFDDIDKLECKDYLFLALCGLSRDMKKDDFGRLVALFYPIHSKDADAQRASRILTLVFNIVDPSYEKYKQLIGKWNYESAEEFLTELKSKVDEGQKIESQLEEQKRAIFIEKHGEETVKRWETHENALYEKRKNADQTKENNKKWLVSKLGNVKTKEFYEIKVTAEMEDYDNKMMLAQRQYLIDNGLNEAEANVFARCNFYDWEIKDKIIKRVQGMIYQRKQWLTEMFGLKAAEQFSQIKKVEEQSKWLTERIGSDFEKYYGKSSAHIELVDGVIEGYECYEQSDYTSFTSEINVSFRVHIGNLLKVTNDRRKWLKKMLGDEAETFDELVEVQAQREWLTRKFNADVANALMDGIFKCEIDDKPLNEMELQIKVKDIGKFDRIMLWLKDNNHNWLYKILESIYNVIFGEKYELTDELIELIRYDQNMLTDKEQNKLNQDLKKIGDLVTVAKAQEDNLKQIKTDQKGVSINNIIPKSETSKERNEI